MVWIILWVRPLVGVVLVGWWLCWGWGWSGEVLGMIVWARFCGGVGGVQVVCGVIVVGAWVWGGFVSWMLDCIGGRGCLGWDRFFFVWYRAGSVLTAMRLPLFFVVPSSQDGMTASKCSVYSTNCSARSFVVNKL